MLRRALTKRHLAGCSAAPQNGYGLNSEASIWEISEIEDERRPKIGQSRVINGLVKFGASR